jgi:hypothetical protein
VSGQRAQEGAAGCEIAKLYFEDSRETFLQIGGGA